LIFTSGTLSRLLVAVDPAGDRGRLGVVPALEVRTKAGRHALGRDHA
jgi:hypothetical protein